MFSKNKDPEAAVQAAPQSQPQAQPQPQPKRDRPARTGSPSVVSADLTVTGTLVSSGDVQVDGRVEGDVRANSLIIGEQAVIQGDVYAEELVIRGKIQGGIRARKVQLCSTCRVEGSIVHEALVVEAGAFFEGNCRHSDNPVADAQQHASKPGGNGMPKAASVTALSN